MNRLLFKKEGKARFISHLDLMRTMQRVFIRSGVSIKHTEGFNPHPYMAFALPLSVGVESQCELLDFVLLGGAELDELPELLTKNSPEGITVLEAYESDRKMKEIAWLEIEGRLSYDNGAAGETLNVLNSLYNSGPLVIEKKTKSGIVNDDIVKYIKKAEFIPMNEKTVRLSAVLAAQNPSISPAQFISAIGQKIPEFSPDFTSMRRIEVYDSENRVFR